MATELALFANKIKDIQLALDDLLAMPEPTELHNVLAVLHRTKEALGKVLSVSDRPLEWADRLSERLMEETLTSATHAKTQLTHIIEEEYFR